MLVRIWLFIFLYGAVALTGLFLTFFWSKFAYVRCTTIPHKCWRDRAFVLSAAIATVACGLTVNYTARVLGNAEFGLSNILIRGEGWFIAVGLFLVLVGLLKMVWLADLERHPPRWIWLRAVIGGTVLWGILAYLLAPGVPYGR